ncbi:MAG: phosphoribosylanthranilate isomerase [Desulfitobacteriaceae bacterium]
MTSLVKVKICGIRSAEEAHWAVEAGADALGFVFHPLSKRSIEPAEARIIVAQLPPFIAKVGVFVDRPRHEVEDIAGQCGLTAVQLHGRELAADYRGMRLPLIKALAPENMGLGEDIDSQEAGFSAVLSDWRGTAQAILLDSVRSGQFGGTGSVLAWERPVVQRAVAAIKHSGLSAILAGGLKPENVVQGIREVQPYAVDVSSGVEYRGRKDRALIQAFVASAKNA